MTSTHHLCVVFLVELLYAMYGQGKHHLELLKANRPVRYGCLSSFDTARFISVCALDADGTSTPSVLEWMLQLR